MIINVDTEKHMVAYVCVRACHSMCVCVRVITHVVLVFFHIPELGVSIKLLDGLQLNLFFANTKSR